jgi:hypothetical protein
MFVPCIVEAVAAALLLAPAERISPIALEYALFVKRA